MTARGLLLTMTEPPAAMDGEFNAWYDDEHLPARLAITSFRSARRRVADVAPGEGRCLGKAVVSKRWAKALLRVAAGAPAEGLVIPGALQIRHFIASAGAPRHLALAELAWNGAPALPAPQPGWFVRLYRAYGA